MCPSQTFSIKHPKASMDWAWVFCKLCDPKCFPHVLPERPQSCSRNHSPECIPHSCMGCFSRCSGLTPCPAPIAQVSAATKGRWAARGADASLHLSLLWRMELLLVAVDFSKDHRGSPDSSQVLAIGFKVSELMGEKSHPFFPSALFLFSATTASTRASHSSQRWTWG